MFRLLIQKLKQNPKKIVFTEGNDERVLEAAARLMSGTFLTDRKSTRLNSSHWS